MAELDNDPVISALHMDRSRPIGNSTGNDSRQALHTKIKNEATDPAFVDVVHSVLPDGASTEAKQDSEIAELQAINANTDDIEPRLGARDETAAAIDTATSGLNGLTKRINQHLTTLEGYVDGLESLITTTNTEIGATNEAAAASDTATSGLNGLIKRINQHLTTLEGYVDGLETQIGATNETAPSTDTATSGLNGRLQRIAQRLTTLLGFYNSDFGATSGGIRTAAIPGNVSGIADFNSGATSAQTPRSAANLYDSAGNALTTRSYASVRPVDVYLPQIGTSSAAHTLVTPTANVSTQLLAANTSRRWAYFINNSGAPFFLKFGTTAVANQGIEIVQNGGFFRMDATLLYLGAINAIVASNNRTIEIIEGT